MPNPYGEVYTPSNEKVHDIMIRNKPIAALLAATLSSISPVYAGRPLTTDDADPVDVGQFELEAGVAYEHDSDCQHGDFPFGLTYGLISDVEVGASFGGQLERRTETFDEASGNHDSCTESSIGDLDLGAKWQFIRACPLGMRHALAPSVKLPTADDDNSLGSGETDYDLTWIASRSIGDKAGTHLNLGYSWIGGPDADILHYGVALDYQLADSVQWVGEVFAEKELPCGTDTVIQYNMGLRWNPTGRVTLDIAGGSKITGDAPDFTATAGLTWAFAVGSINKKEN